MKPIVENQVAFSIECEPEYDSIEGNCSAVDPARLCPNKAVEVAALADEQGHLWQWMPLCADCLGKFGPALVRREQYAALLKACKAVGISPEYATECVNKQYKPK